MSHRLQTFNHQAFQVRGLISVGRCRFDSRVRCVMVMFLTSEFQARLKRIEARLVMLREEAASAAVAAIIPPAAVLDAVSQQFAGGYMDNADRRQDHYAPAPPKRKASDLSRNQGEVKRVKSGAFEGGDQRLVPTGRMRSTYAQCEKILDLLMRDPASMAYFNVPVDYVALGGRIACPEFVVSAVTNGRRS
jgi:hypothetical protein